MVGPDQNRGHWKKGPSAKSLEQKALEDELSKEREENRKCRAAALSPVFPLRLTTGGICMRRVGRLGKG